ncbi:hypothetical protein P3T33_001309 [Rhizobium sp. AN67]|nr:hypothetical protein [Rhizobium sp. AN67]
MRAIGYKTSQPITATDASTSTCRSRRRRGMIFWWR